MNRSYLIWVIVIMLNLICYSDCNKSNRIHGGKMTTELLPYQVLIYALTQTSVVQTRTCAGSLITVNYVLTSASCIDRTFTAQLIFGAHYSNRIESTQVVMATVVIKPHIHWHYAKYRNDVGLIRLPEPIKLVNGVIGLIKLPPISKPPHRYTGEMGKTSGWGINSDVVNPVHFFLKDVNVKVLADDKCKTTYPQMDMNLTFCAIGDYNGNPCEGDQGAPLVIQKTNIQIGIASYGSDKCESSDPYVYTKVADYLDWIVLNSDYKASA